MPDITCQVSDVQNRLPIPTDTRNHKKSRYPFRKMNVGNHFTMIGRKMSSVYNSMKYFSRKDPNKAEFIAQKQPDNSIVVWRIR